MINPARKTARDVINEVAQAHGLTFAEMSGPRRLKRLSEPRSEAYYEAYVQCPHISLPAIGRILGGRDHSTVRSGIIAHGKRIGVDYADVKRSGPRYPHTPYMSGSFVPGDASQYRSIARLSA